MGKQNKNQDSSGTGIQILPGVLTGLLILFLVLIPDEKLVREKLQIFELGILLALIVSGFLLFVWPNRSYLSPSINGRLKSPKIFRVFLAIVGAWFLYQLGRAMTASEGALAAGELRRIFFGGCAFISFSLFPWPQNSRKCLLGIWTILAGLLGLYALLQLRGGWGPISVPLTDRPFGTFGNPIFLAAFLGVSILLGLGSLAAFEKRSARIVIILCLVFQVIGFAVTQTRAAWIGLIVGFMGWFILSRRLPKVSVWVWFVGLSTIILGIFLTKDIWSRDQGHLLIWRDTIKMWMDHFWFGVGPGRFHAEFVNFAGADLKSKWPQGNFIINFAHNEILQTFAETGVVGGLLFLLVPISFVTWVYRSRKNMAPESLGLAAAALALFVQNIFSVDMRFSISFILFFMLLGLTVAFHEPIFSGKGELSSYSVKGWQKAGGIFWGVFIVGVLVPYWWTPYRAQKEVKAQVGFFDERLLEPAKTIQDLESLAEKYPEQPAILERLAYAYSKEIIRSDKSLNRSMADKAIGAYEALIKLDPNRIAAQNNLGNIFYTLGNANRALDHWRRAVEINPNFLDGHLNLGKVLYLQGRLDPSTKHFERVLEIDPNNAEAKVFLRRMLE